MKSIKYIIATALLLVAISGFSQNTILGYEYWFDNNYSAKVSQTVTPEANFSLSTQIPTAGLVPGIHTFNFRTWDNEGMYSVVLSSFFYKIPQTSTANKEIVVYEYWFDNDYANKTTIAVAPQTHFNLSELLDTEELVSGIHTLNIRFKDNSDLWSSTLSQFFYKLIIRETEIADNYITAYRYWFNSDFANAEYVQLAEPAKNFNLIENMDFTRIPKGEYEISFQFRDTLGLWSSVITDEVEKVAFPIADFSYELNTTCENTTVTFTGNNFDNDTQSWNFGDGETSEEISPVYTYGTPGDYTVSLTVTDTETGNDSTKTIVISIPDLRTTHSFSENVCDTYTAPDGQVYTGSNPNITAIIPNAAGCDSIITINLTIHEVDTSVEINENTLTANASSAEYQWLDCDNDYGELQGETEQTFSPSINGNYAVRITQNGCVDVSNCHHITTITSINEVETVNYINIYPNPTNGRLIIENEQLKIGKVIIYDMNGKKLSTFNYPLSIAEIDLSDYANGIYFIEVNKTTHKIIKK